MRVTTDRILDERFNEWERKQEEFELLEDRFQDWLKENDYLGKDEKKALTAEFLSDPDGFFKEW